MLEGHLSIKGLENILQRLNDRHRDTARQGYHDDYLAGLEETIEACFGPSKRLAVYGSLAPGQKNHYILENLSGTWLQGFISGKIFDRGWGAGLGYPGAIWKPGGIPVDVHVLVSDQLCEHWQRLDRFEGDEYRRSLVPVYNQSGLLCIANIYELRA